MKHLSEYRNGTLARELAQRIRASSKKPVRLMEICGTHTVSIFRHGIRNILPPTITLISGPGCPVCVTSVQDLDRAIALARIPNVILATYGDLLRVPGSETSLSMEKAKGAAIEIVYASFDALKLASENPGKPVVFLGIGFETTSPTIAATILEAKRAGLKNFFVFSAHKLLPPALNALLLSGDLNIHGFICPGHVTTIIGTKAYEEVARRFGTPCVVTGFEPIDILQSIAMLVDQLEKGEARVEIQYTRAVAAEGNLKAQAVLKEVFEPSDAYWRGLGKIPLSGLKIREEFKNLDAERAFSLSVPVAQEPPGCACGEILRGIKTPIECLLFRKVCNPTHPVGPCMVSTEGTCAAYYKYSDES